MVVSIRALYYKIYNNNLFDTSHLSQLSLLLRKVQEYTLPITWPSYQISHLSKFHN